MFAPYYAQRMASAIVMMDARAILKGIDAARRARLQSPSVSTVCVSRPVMGPDGPWLGE